MFALGSKGLFPLAFSESMEAVFATVAPIAKGDGLFVAGLHSHAHAVDLAPMIDFDGDGKPEVRWDWALYEKLASAMKKAAVDLKVNIVWGGDWISFKDGPHFELDRKVYPT